MFNRSFAKFTKIIITWFLVFLFILPSSSIMAGAALPTPQSQTICGQDLNKDGFVDTEYETADCITLTEGQFCPIGAVDCVANYYVIPTCPPGSTYNKTTDRCEISIIKNCPTGFTLSGNVCTANPICPPGSTYNKTTDRCEKSAIPYYVCSHNGAVFSNRTSCQTNCIQTARCIKTTQRFKFRLRGANILPVVTSCRLRTGRFGGICDISSTKLTIIGQDLRRVCIRWGGDDGDRCRSWRTHYVNYYINPNTGQKYRSRGSFQGWEGQGGWFRFVSPSPPRCTSPCFKNVLPLTFTGANWNRCVPGFAWFWDRWWVRTCLFHYYTGLGFSCPIGSYKCTGGNAPTCSKPQTCERRIKCPTGFTLSGNVCTANSTCPPGSTLNKTTDRCEISIIKNCPTGFTLSGNVCTANPICPPGSTLDKTKDWCKINPTITCLHGGTLNKTTNRCELNPTIICQSGFTYSGGQCVKNVDDRCPTGYTRTGNVCTAIPTCPPGSTYNKTTDRCERNVIPYYVCLYNGAEFSNRTSCQTNCIQTAQCIKTTQRFKGYHGHANRALFGHVWHIPPAACQEGICDSNSMKLILVAQSVREGECLRWDDDDDFCIDRIMHYVNYYTNPDTGQKYRSEGRYETDWWRQLAPPPRCTSPCFENALTLTSIGQGREGCVVTGHGSDDGGWFGGDRYWTNYRCYAYRYYTGPGFSCPIGRYKCTGAVPAVPAIPSIFTRPHPMDPAVPAILPACSKPHPCERRVKCPTGFTLSGNVCTANPICSYGTTVNKVTDKCEVSSFLYCPMPSSYSFTLNKCVFPARYTCPAPNYAFSPVSRLCESSPNTHISGIKDYFRGEFTCPLKGGACMSVNGILRCSPNQCVNIGNQTPFITEMDNRMLMDDGARDEFGNCLNEIFIFTGRGIRCRPSGVSIGLLNDCCRNTGEEVMTDSVGSIANIHTKIKAIRTTYNLARVAIYTKQAIADGVVYAMNPVMTASQPIKNAVTVGYLTGSVQKGMTHYLKAAFDPTTLAISIAIHVVMKLLFGACDAEDIETALLRDSGFCHYIGSYCEKEWFLVGCVQRARGFCCFNSKLGRIIHQQGRIQLHNFQPGGAWGDGKSPNCRGFTPDEFQMLDFSKIDMSEYFHVLQKNIEGRIRDTQLRGMERVKEFYDKTQ